MALVPARAPDIRQQFRSREGVLQGTMRCWIWALLVSCVALQTCAAQQAFLQQQLPLKVLVTTPSELLASRTMSEMPAVTMTGRQAITVVFSRPVIALGSDWAVEQLPASLVPFTLSCGTPGRLRWVTTNIARFDPSQEWPTDLDCTLDWNQALTAYDGAPLQLADLQLSVRLQTQPLTMTVQQVQSEAASAATGGQWSAFLGSPDDRLPEVPPDANLTLSFSYPVELLLLAKSLKVAGPSAGGRAVVINPCITPSASPVPLPLIFSSTGMQYTPAAAIWASRSSVDLLKLNSTCAVVTITPGLEPGAAAVLRLPKGARYNSLAGATSQDTDVDVYGLRAFRIPLRWDYMNITTPTEQLYNAVAYRRLTMWLPHGLAQGISLAALQSALQFCCLADPFSNIDGSGECIPQPFDISRPYPAVVAMRVPALNPRQRCKVSISAAPEVKDAFGLSLQPSSSMWWSQDLDPAYTGPSVRQIAILEMAPGKPPLQWPWVSRGVPEEGIRQVQAMRVPVKGPGASGGDNNGSLLERAISAVLAGYSGASASLFGSAGIKVARQDATWPTFQSLALPREPGISLIGSCCRTVSWPTQREVMGTSAMVVQSNLQAAFIEQGGKVIAWVTTTQGSSRPVQGARVQVYNSVYGQDAATPGPACTTKSDGTCSVDLVKARSARQQATSSGSSPGESSYQPVEFSGTYTAVITAEGHGPLVVPELPNSARYMGSATNKEYVATLVLDRKLVRPGDDLHVTAFIQRKQGAELVVAKDLTSVVLQVTPSFDRPAGTRSSASSGSNLTRITVAVDPVFGTAHAIVPVPKNATPAQYTLQLWTSTPGSSASDLPGDIPEPGSPDVVIDQPIAVLTTSSDQPVAQSTVEALSAAAAANVKAAGVGDAFSAPYREDQAFNSSNGTSLPKAGAVSRTSAGAQHRPRLLMEGVTSRHHDTGSAVNVQHSTAPKAAPEPVAAGLRSASVSSSWTHRLLQQMSDQMNAVLGIAVDPSNAGPDPAAMPEVMTIDDAPVVSTLPNVGTGASGLASDAVNTSQTNIPAVDSVVLSQPGSQPISPPHVSKPWQQPLGASLAYTTFTVGDPRPPTASLVLSTQSNWVKPDGVVTLDVATRSYIGSDVSDAEVTVGWSTGKATGEVVLRTNASGVATGTLKLGELPATNRSEVGDSLSLKATWIGPTREPLMQSRSIKIMDGPIRVELQRTLVTDVPGIAFGVRAEAFSNEDDSPVKGAAVDITLEPRNGSSSLSSCTAAQRGSLAQQKCSILSGDPAAAAACQVVLPCPGDFILKGCITSQQQTGCSKGIRVGRNASSWDAAPWASGPGQIVLLVDRKNVTLGEDVSLTLQNPYWGPASALVVWGNSVHKEQFFLNSIPPGASTVVIRELGPECKGGCTVTVTLAAARPHGVSATVSSRSAVQDDEALLNVALDVPFDSQHADDAVPGASFELDVHNATNARNSAIEEPSAAATPRGLAGNAAGSQQISTDVMQQGITSTQHSTIQAHDSSSAVRPHSWLFGGMWPFGTRAAGVPRPRTINVGLSNLPDSSRGLLRSVRRYIPHNERGMSVPAARTNTIAALPDIPRSVLYDPYAPITVSADVELRVPDSDKLSVQVMVDGQSRDAAGVAVVAPQSKQGSISVTVKDGKGTVVRNAEVTVMVVDKAILDQMPYQLQDVSAAMRPKPLSGFSFLHLNNLRVNRAAINATFSTLQRRLISMDPWLPVDTQVTASDGWGPMDATADMSWLPPAAAVDVSDAQYLQRFSTPLTPMPYRPCPVGEVNCPRPAIAEQHLHMGFGNTASATLIASDAAEGMIPLGAAVPAPAPAPGAQPPQAMAKTTSARDSPQDAQGAAGLSAATADALLRLQQAFKITPLFKVVSTDASGRATLDFPAPDNLGRFIVRAYVAAPQAVVKAGGSGAAVLYGAGESQLVVRRTVSLTPSLPRQVRVGDEFEAGVLVEAAGTLADMAVTVTAKLSPAAGSSGSNVLQLGRDTSKLVILSPSRPQQEVRFAFSADAVGEQNITFAAAATGGAATSGFRPSLPTGAVRGLKQLLLSARTGPRDAAVTPAGAVADQVQLRVPVHGRQGEVVVATSFAVRGSSSSSGGAGAWQEGMVLPSAEPGSGSISLVAGVGSLPAIKAAYTGLAEQGLGPSGCASAPQAVALSLLPAFLDLYQPADPAAAAATPFLSAQQVQLTQAAVTTAVTKLTNERFGLLSIEPRCLHPSSRGPDRADIALNAWASWLTRQAVSSSAADIPESDDNSTLDFTNSSSAGIASSATTLSSAWRSVQSATKTWVNALEAQVVTDAMAARRGSKYAPPGAYQDLEALSWARLVLGPSWKPQMPRPTPGSSTNTDKQSLNTTFADVLKDVSMHRLAAAALAGNLSVGGQARVGLALQREPQLVVGRNKAGQVVTAADAVQKISTRLVNNIRVGGRTAYVASGTGARGAAGLSDQSLALTLFVSAGVDNPLVQKLAAWVAQGAAPPPMLFAAVSVSSSPWDSTLRSHALATYDSSTASLTPDLKLTVSAQPKPSLTSKRAPVTLLTAEFNPDQGSNLESSTSSWDAVPSNSSLVFKAVGSGEVSIAATLNFTPADLLPFPTYRGLWVQQAFSVQEGGLAGSSSRDSWVSSAQAGVGLGKIVMVGVQVTSPDDQPEVLVDVMMPGGLEPMDPNVMQDPDAATICGVSEDESPLDAGMGPGNMGFATPKVLARPVATSVVPGMDAGPAMVGSPLFGRRIWPVCPLQTTSPDRVTFRFAYMRAGTHTVRFRAVAATTGSFVVPPVKAHVQQQPEVMGLSPAGTLTVCAEAQGGCMADKVPATAPAPAAVAPAKACPQDCNGNGACNLARGVCICDAGFVGVSCGDLSMF